MFPCIFCGCVRKRDPFQPFVHSLIPIVFVYLTQADTNRLLLTGVPRYTPQTIQIPRTRWVYTRLVSYALSLGYLQYPNVNNTCKPSLMASSKTQVVGSNPAEPTFFAKKIVREKTLSSPRKRQKNPRRKKSLSRRVLSKFLTLVNG